MNKVDRAIISGEIRRTYGSTSRKPRRSAGHIQADEYAYRIFAVENNETRNTETAVIENNIGKAEINQNLQENDNKILALGEDTDISFPKSGNGIITVSSDGRNVTKMALPDDASKLAATT